MAPCQGYRCVQSGGPVAADTLGGAYRKLHHQLLQDNQLHQLSQAKEIQASFFTLWKFLGWFYTEINKLDWSLLIDELYKRSVSPVFVKETKISWHLQ